MSQFSIGTQSTRADNNILVEGIIPMTRRGDVISGDYWLEIAKGNIRDHQIVFLSGKNEDVAVSSNESVWMGGGLYPWSAWDGGAANLYIGSSNAADTSVTLLVSGLDINYNVISEVISTSAVSGTTYVATVNQYYRLNSVINIGSKACVGNISLKYGSSSGTVVGYVDSVSQQHRASIYTVPAGYTAYTVYGDFSVSGNNYCQLDAHWRFFGGVFVQIYSTETTGAFKADPIAPGAIPEKTDIDNRVSQGTNNLRVSSNQQLILVKNSND